MILAVSSVDAEDFQRRSCTAARSPPLSTGASYFRVAQAGPGVILAREGRMDETCPIDSVNSMSGMDGRYKVNRQAPRLRLAAGREMFGGYEVDHKPMFEGCKSGTLDPSKRRTGASVPDVAREPNPEAAPCRVWKVPQVSRLRIGHLDVISARPGCLRQSRDDQGQKSFANDPKGIPPLSGRLRGSRRCLLAFVEALACRG